MIKDRRGDVYPSSAFRNFVWNSYIAADHSVLVELEDDAMVFLVAAGYR
jgi:hypothetical protein